MSEILLINGKKYIYRCNYRDDNMLRSSFDRVTVRTDGCMFIQW